MAAKTTIKGLTSGSIYYVRHMAIYKDGPGYLVGPIKVKVGSNLLNLYIYWFEDVTNCWLPLLFSSNYSIFKP